QSDRIPPLEHTAYKVATCCDSATDRSSANDIIERGNTDHICDPHHHPLAIAADSQPSCFDEIDVARRLCVTQIVDIGVFEMQVQSIPTDQGAQINVRAIGIKDDCSAFKVLVDRIKIHEVILRV